MLFQAIALEKLQLATIGEARSLMMKIGRIRLEATHLLNMMIMATLSMNMRNRKESFCTSGLALAMEKDIGW